MITRLSECQVKILKYCKDEKFHTTHEIVIKTGYIHYTIQANIKELVSQAYMMKEKNDNRSNKYQITLRGKRLVRLLE